MDGWTGVIGDRAFLADKEEIIQTISRSPCAIIRSHLFSRAIVLFIELLCCMERGGEGRWEMGEGGGAVSDGLTHAVPQPQRLGP